MPTICEREESAEVPESVPMLTRHTAQRGNGFRQLGHACKKRKGGILNQTSIVDVKSLLIWVFFLAPRDQLRQRNQPATSRAAGYPKQPATSSQPATPASSPAPVIIALAEIYPKDCN
jgi:hypothetical protein